MDSRLTDRKAWVDIAKAISITLVVMMHSTFGVGESTGGVGFMHTVLAFATPFRMPEFFLISGLFLSLVIARPWSRFADRRVLHYLYFYAVWAFILIGFKHLLVERDPLFAARLLVEAFYEPYSVLWFIYALAILSILAKLAWQMRLPGAAVFALAALASILPIDTPVLLLDYTAEYFVYFFAGYAFAPTIFSFAEWVGRRPLLALAGLAGWALVNALVVFGPAHIIAPGAIVTGASALPGTTLVLGLMGAVAICTIAVLLERLPATAWLAWVGAHSIVIYLSFVLPMGIFRTLLLSLMPGLDVGVASLAVLIVALTSPLLVYGLIRKIGYGRFLFERPDWAHLPGSRRPAHEKMAPQPAQ